MIQIIVPIFIGLLLFGILPFWFLSGRDSEKRQLDIAEAHTALRYLQSGAERLNLIDRISDQQDLIFVLSEKDRNLLTLLSCERRAVALLWLRRIHQQVMLLMNFHVRSVRSSAKLGPVIELRLAFQFLVFASIYYAFFTLIWTRGPFRARKVASFISIALRNFSAVSQQALAIANSRCMGIPRDAGTGSLING
ncbi:MAG TPA: hypothetical protein VJN21_11410 [Candidatus Acidoferrales bacterium]|nr:hypothetical protein [Candidatus Acidoferrales bacterium]